MNWLKRKIFDIVLHRYAMGSLVDVYKKLDGYKTVLSLIGIVATYICELNGLDSKVTEALYTFFGGTASVAWFEKLKKYDAEVKNVVQEVKEEAAKSSAGESSGS